MDDVAKLINALAMLVVTGRCELELVPEVGNLPFEVFQLIIHFSGELFPYRRKRIRQVVLWGALHVRPGCSLPVQGFVVQLFGVCRLLDAPLKSFCCGVIAPR